MIVDRSHIISTCCEVAFHEAGHVLFMDRYGYQVRAVEIRWNDEESLWYGEAERILFQPLQRMDLLNPNIGALVTEAAIAFSGCLVQALYLSRQKHPCSLFLSDQAWDELFSWMQNTDSQSRKPFDLFFDSPVGRICVPADPRWFGGVDQSALLRLQNLLVLPLHKRGFWERFRDSLITDVAFINSNEFWERATMVANPLIEQIARLPQGPYSAKVESPLAVGKRR